MLGKGSSVFLASNSSLDCQPPHAGSATVVCFFTHKHTHTHTLHIYIFTYMFSTSIATCLTEHIHKVYNTHPSKVTILPSVTQQCSAQVSSPNNATLKHHHPLPHPQFQSHPLTTRPLLHTYHDMCPFYPAASPTNDSVTMHEKHNKEHYT